MAAKSESSRDLYIGLMSGTSLDGIDAVLVHFREDQQPILLASLCHPLPAAIRQAITDLIAPDWQGSLHSVGILNQQLGKCFADACTHLLQHARMDAQDVTAIGSHGQTIWHQPGGEHPFTWQLGDASQIAEQTNITTIADFRSRDMAAGGQGAPLVPAFHRSLLTSDITTQQAQVMLNIGGIANITVLSSEQTLGFDTGPGNTLIDAWASHHLDTRYDTNGDWAASGTINESLLNTLLNDPYFALPAPKSTGREYFNTAWLKRHKAIQALPANDVQATLTELTARSIGEAICRYAPATHRVYSCGGGAHNQHLQQRIQHYLPPQTDLTSTADLGIHPDWMEAIAFAWLAKRTLKGKSGNLPAVTGASGERILGAIYPA